MYQKITLLGRLGADPETRFTQNNVCVSNANLATSERWRDAQGEKQERTEWHRLVFWDRLGEIAQEYLKKGSLVFIEGKVETQKWEDKDGETRYNTTVRVLSMQMIDNRTGGEDRGSAGKTAYDTPPPKKQDPAEFTGDVDDDLPF